MFVERENDFLQTYDPYGVGINVNKNFYKHTIPTESGKPTPIGVERL